MRTSQHVNRSYDKGSPRREASQVSLSVRELQSFLSSIENKFYASAAENIPSNPKGNCFSYSFTLAELLSQRFQIPFCCMQGDFSMGTPDFPYLAVESAQQTRRRNEGHFFIALHISGDRVLAVETVLEKKSSAPHGKKLYAGIFSTVMERYGLAPNNLAYRTNSSGLIQIERKLHCGKCIKELSLVMQKGAASSQRRKTDRPVRINLKSQEQLRRCWTGRASEEEQQKFFRFLLKRCQAYLEDKLPSRPLPTYGYLSDSHGDYDSFKVHLANMRDRGVNQIIVMGDGMDHNIQSGYLDKSLARKGSGAQGIMQEIMSKREISYVLGNHDLLMMQSMAGDPAAFALWISNGALSTLHDFGLDRGLIREIHEVWTERKRELENPSGGNIRARLFEQLGMSNGLGAHEHLAILLETVREVPGLQRVNNFLRKNSSLYFIDAFGSLALHAGLPVDDKTGAANLFFSGRSNLDALDYCESLLPGPQTFRSFAAMAERKHSFLWGTGFWRAFEKKKESTSLLSSLAVMRIIHGHEEPHFTPRSGRSRLLEAALSHSGGSTGWFMVGPEGIVFINKKNKALAKLGLPGEKLIESVAGECLERLKLPD